MVLSLVLVLNDLLLSKIMQCQKQFSYCRKRIEVLSQLFKCYSELMVTPCFLDSLLSQQQNSWPPSASCVTEPTSSNWPFSSQPPQSSFQGLYLLYQST